MSVFDENIFSHKIVTSCRNICRNSWFLKYPIVVLSPYTESYLKKYPGINVCQYPIAVKYCQFVLGFNIICLYIHTVMLNFIARAE